MKSLLIVGVMLAIYSTAYSQACCCTGVGSNYSILPNLDKHVIGLRYTHRTYFSETHSLNPELDGKVTNQRINSVELFGRFNIYKRLQLSVFIPVNFISQHDTKGGTEKTAGPGDMSFLFQYNLLNPLKCNGKKWKQQLRLGAGFKLPVGEFKMGIDQMFATSLQLGTGSVDFITNAIYTFRLNGFGLNAGAGYKFNTANTQGYRFGDKVQSNASVFYVFDIKSVQLMPLVGVNYEHQFYNRKKGRALSFTGGDFLTAAVGLDVYYKQFACSATFSPAVMNRLNWNGENKNKFNVEAGVFYNFSTSKTK